MDSWTTLDRDGVRLACRHFGGGGQPVLLLHGLAGHADEWAQTASWLTRRCRVEALDARGHGRSERAPADVSLDAQVADAAFVIERLGLRPVVLVGQSLGGVTALVLAAEQPDLVRGLVLVDASPSGGPEEAESAAAEISAALQRWPVPCRSRAAALDFFGERFGSPLAAAAWADGLEQRDDGWWPRFEVEVMARTLLEALREPIWDRWEHIGCPTLVVRAGKGIVEPDIAREMIARLPGAGLVEIADAAHDLHLDRPDEWRETLSDFLDALPAGTD
jgi:pimeloyl-ACP methyl ester carboxylesterase